MKLKTLKELEKTIPARTREHTFKELKAEAIKWYKAKNTVEGAKFWIMAFFNITEEDLK